MERRGAADHASCVDRCREAEAKGSPVPGNRWLAETAWTAAAPSLKYQPAASMIEVTLYTRRDCELCREMEEVLESELPRFDAALRRIEVDDDPALETSYGQEVPVLFVNQRKAFKFRCTAKELRKRLLREVRR
jgi:glutaredoxin